MCCSNTNNYKRGKNTLDESLSTFIRKFDALRLPFSLQKRSFYKYSNIDFDTVNLNDPKNPYYQTIDKRYFKYLQNGNIDSSCTFHFLHASRHDSFYIILYQQVNEVKESYLTKMNTLDSKGNIIDTLLLAGFKVNVNEKYGQIDEKWNIKTVLYNYLQDEPSISALVADVVNEEFTLTSAGYFKRTLSRDQKGYFNIVDDTLVPYRKK
jgi:hypothetical protein